MIHIDCQSEPPSFDIDVRQKGQSWLSSHDMTKHTKFPDYWRSCLLDLYTSYSNCCAYLGLFLHSYEGMGTVDHFHPKSKYPKLAYEWSNYRLCTQRINARKRDYEDVLDPFEIENGWFQLDLDITGKVFPSPDVSEAIKVQIEQTIHRLDLNNSIYCDARLTYWNEYRLAPDLLYKKAPFVYCEATRQGLIC